MKKKYVIVLAAFFVVVGYCVCWAAERSITIPKNTVSTKLGPGHYQFKLPDNRIIEITGFNPVNKSFTLLREISGQKVQRGGKQGRIINSQTVSRQKSLKIPPRDRLLIEDSSLMLPATFSFNEVNADDLAAAFMKLGMSDPGKSSESESSLADLANAARCKQSGGKWNSVTKTCEK